MSVVALDSRMRRSPVTVGSRRRVFQNPSNRTALAANDAPLDQVRQVCNFLRTCLIWSATGAANKQRQYGGSLIVCVQRKRRGTLVEIYCRGKRRGGVFLANDLRATALQEMQRAMSAELFWEPRTRRQRELARVANRLKGWGVLALL